jgi:light-regulated signal transduction histidine kinase (bacteriophytochrome)
MCKDGSILPVLMSSTVVIDPQGHIVMTRSTMIDNSNRKRIEEEMQKSQIGLEEANRDLHTANNELEAFSYSVSHDLLQPLRAIEGFSHIIKEEYAGQLNPEGIRLLDSIQRNSKKMDQLIMDLLALSRVSRSGLKCSKMVMSDLARTVFEENAPVEEDKHFEFCLYPIPDAYGDPILIHQVWSNLISNSIKYTLPKKDRKIEIGSYQENGMDVYFVKDNGVGFDGAYTHKLFGVFQRLHNVNEFEGTGVGLAIVKRIINRHGGVVWAEGTINRGATFYFSLPIMKNQA